MLAESGNKSAMHLNKLFSMQSIDLTSLWRRNKGQDYVSAFITHIGSLIQKLRSLLWSYIRLSVPAFRAKIIVKTECSVATLCYAKLCAFRD